VHWTRQERAFHTLPDVDPVCYPGDVLAREVAELHREKMELLDENASLKKVEFLFGRFFSPGGCP